MSKKQLQKRVRDLELQNERQTIDYTNLQAQYRRAQKRLANVTEELFQCISESLVLKEKKGLL